MIVENRQAGFKYHIHDTYTAGMVLEGWEVKSIRAKRVTLTSGYVYVREGEVYLVGAQIVPLSTTNFGEWKKADTERSRKLLLNKKEIKRLMGKVQEDGMTIVPLKMFWSKGRVKLEIALAKGKNDRDKRQDVKDRDWNREQSRIIKTNVL